MQTTKEAKREPARETERQKDKRKTTKQEIQLEHLARSRERREEGPRRETREGHLQKGRVACRWVFCRVSRRVGGEEGKLVIVRLLGLVFILVQKARARMEDDRSRGNKQDRGSINKRDQRKKI